MASNHESDTETPAPRTDTTDDPPELDDLFRGQLDTVAAFSRRRRAAACPGGYRALYYCYIHPDDEVTKDDLRDFVDESDLQPLLNNNLIAQCPYPDGRATIRLTGLGKYEIESVIRWAESGNGDVPLYRP